MFCGGVVLWERFHRDCAIRVTSIGVEPLPQCDHPRLSTPLLFINFSQQRHQSFAFFRHERCRNAVFQLARGGFGFAHHLASIDGQMQANRAAIGRVRFALQQAALVEISDPLHQIRRPYAECCAQLP